jgi:N4-gp56 family major capsid protein
MAATRITDISGAYQTHFSKELLSHAVQSVILSQFGQKSYVQRNQGNYTVTFFRRSAAANNSSGRVANVAALTEGTPVTANGITTLASVVATLAQIGTAASISDRVTYTGLFNMVEQTIEQMGEECVLEADNIIRDAIVGGSPAVLYAGGAANFAALNSLSRAAGKFRMLEALIAVTKLKRARCPRVKGGHYIGAIPVEVSFDLQNDPDWIGVARYQNAKAIYNGEIGMFGGARFVEHTNPFIETSSGSEGTFADPGVTATTRVLGSLFFGQGGFGIPAFAGQKVPEDKRDEKDAVERVGVKPQVLIANTPDKSDPLNQLVTVGWKMDWTAKVLNTGWVVHVKSKTEFNG